MRRLFGKKAGPSLDEQDQMVIEQMRSLGWDLAQDRLVENFLYFPTREASEAARVESGALGYEASALPAPDGKSWVVQANRRQAVTIEAVRRMRAELTSIAEAGGGEYDGWGAGE